MPHRTADDAANTVTVARRPTRLLVATRHNPFPENDGAGAYLFDLLSYLTEHDFEIEVAWLHADGALTHRGHWRTPDPFAKVARLQIIGGRSIGQRLIFPQALWLPFKARRLHEIKTVLSALGFRFLFREGKTTPPAQEQSNDGALTARHWSALPTPEESAFFQKRLRAFRPDAVLLNYCWLAPLLDGLDALPTAILTNDVVSQRLERTPGLAVDPATPEGEAGLLGRVRHILAISEDDAAYFRTRLPAHSVINTPKAAEPRTITSPVLPHRVLFVGGINDFNREGIHWFLTEVWPLVRAQNPQATLHVCGGVGSTIENVPANVVIRGRVPDLAREYAEATAVIVPLLHGTGVKIKLVEAASFGKPIITTPVGLQGLGFLRTAVVEAAQAVGFADGVLTVLSSNALQQKLSQAVLQQVAAHLSRESAYGPVRQALAVSSP